VTGAGGRWQTQVIDGGSRQQEQAKEDRNMRKTCGKEAVGIRTYSIKFVLTPATSCCYHLLLSPAPAVYFCRLLLPPAPANCHYSRILIYEN
jgi:hypothetical protein